MFIREPHDGLFPVIKHVDEMEAEDVEPLIKADLKEVLKTLIDREQLDEKVTHALVS